MQSQSLIKRPTYSWKDTFLTGGLSSSLTEFMLDFASSIDKLHNLMNPT